VTVRVAPHPVPLAHISAHLDTVLRVADVPDYAGAVNGVQVDHAGPVTRCAVAVDASLRTIEGAIAAGANLLVVHHGLFWGGVQPLRGRIYRRFHALHVHPTLGNNHLLAESLGLCPSSGFAKHESIAVGVRGEADVETAVLVAMLESLAHREGGRVTAVGVETGRRTRRWAICTGAGASSDTLHEAAAAGVDTLIVGEGPHHTAVDGPELGIAVLYAGHYATETFGIRALGAEIERTFGVPWSFVDAPTGL
jgi:putative NIF3 family GTP cyclohydrolase 1 type 2